MTEATQSKLIPLEELYKLMGGQQFLSQDEVRQMFPEIMDLDDIRIALAKKGHRVSFVAERDPETGLEIWEGIDPETRRPKRRVGFIVSPKLNQPAPPAAGS